MLNFYIPFALIGGLSTVGYAFHPTTRLNILLPHQRILLDLPNRLRQPHKVVSKLIQHTSHSPLTVPRLTPPHFGRTLNDTRSACFLAGLNSCTSANRLSFATSSPCVAAWPACRSHRYAVALRSVARRASGTARRARDAHPGNACVGPVHRRRRGRKSDPGTAVQRIKLLTSGCVAGMVVASNSAASIVIFRKRTSSCELLKSSSWPPWERGSWGRCRVLAGSHTEVEDPEGLRRSSEDG